MGREFNLRCDNERCRRLSNGGESVWLLAEDVKGEITVASIYPRGDAAKSISDEAKVFCSKACLVTWLSGRIDQLTGNAPAPTA